MTSKKRTDETPPAEDVVEMDAMDEAEWEKDQHTPMVQDSQLQKLVKETADSSGPAKTAAKPTAATKPPTATAKTVKRAPTSAGVDAKSAPAKSDAAPSGRAKRSTKSQPTSSTAAAPKPPAPAPAPVDDDAWIELSEGDVSSPAPAAPSTGPVGAKPGSRTVTTNTVSRSGAVKPGGAKPDAAKPDAAKPDAAKPDAAKPEPAKPEPAKPEPAKPDTAKASAAPSPPAKADATPVTAQGAKSGATPVVAKAADSTKTVAPGANTGSPRRPATTPPPVPVKAGLPPPRSRTPTGGVKPLSPMALSRKGTPIQRDTPDPTSAPIRQVLNAFQGNANSSGTSTKAALEALRDESGKVPAAAPVLPSQATLDALRDASGPVKTATEDAPSVVVEPPELPAPPAVAAATPPGGMAARRDPTPSPSTINVTPFSAPKRDATPTPAPAKGDASPYPVVSREASNSTSPGAASFAEAPSTAGRPDDFDESERRAIAPARAFNIVAFVKTTRGMAIAGGAAVLVIILLVVAFSGGTKSDGKKAPVAAKKPESGHVATNDKTGGETPDETSGAGATGTHHASTNSGESGGEASGETTGETGDELGSDAAEGSGATGSGATTGATGTTGGAKTGGTKTGGAKTGPTIGGKQVVLEYDSQARTAEPVHNNAPKSDQTAISKARTSYAAGNQRLFAGDADGAIRYYKQALSYYPAYVAGYRGLGLAYAQLGDKPAALRAFRTYVSSVPGAKDAALIRKRIASLQAK